MKQKTEITLEVEETIILRQSGNKFKAFCPQCQALVEMITPQITAALTGLGEREIFRLIEAAEIHFVEAERIFVCRDSLANGSEPPALASGVKPDAEICNGQHFNKR